MSKAEGTVTGVYIDQTAARFDDFRAQRPGGALDSLIMMLMS
ncbi:MAG TPA: hypothetical protein VNV60_12330 [Holophagaceae bacterium]|jgi:hypothetical protein|nr:hypothetical protein [Holophagaceae bacterium]